jgi:mannose-1-phosphate guanylyltransferase/mannose-6-phosphate isomerase
MAHRPIVPIVLAGGAGARLWPVSRDALPKQFLPLFGDLSTYQQTLQRLSDKARFTDPIVITGPQFHFFAQRQAEAVQAKPLVVVEPARRDSAPALAAAAEVARRKYKDAVALAVAADHVILDPELFCAAALAGFDAADSGRIVTFGIRPTEPKTNYGYIEPGARIDGSDVFAVDTFKEKPDGATAARYIADGFYWNSGNFLFKAETLLAELAAFEPAIAAAAAAAVDKATEDLGFLRLDKEAFEASPAKSIDHAVMERTKRAAVVAGNFRWSDIGSWDSLSELSAPDDNGNIFHGDVVAMEAKNCLVHSNNRLTTLIGTRDLVVVSTSDAVLVAERARTQGVKQLVDRLKEAGRTEATDHPRVHRPWGYYESIDNGDRFQVKRIVVTIGGKLSLQKHAHRAEHWVVVRGTAEVTIGETVQLVHENQSVYIPIGSVHRLANPGKIPLELIEIQTGSYLGEDDIVRLDDIYQRS